MDEGGTGLASGPIGACEWAARGICEWADRGPPLDSVGKAGPEAIAGCREGMTPPSLESIALGDSRRLSVTLGDRMLSSPSFGWRRWFGQKGVAECPQCVLRCQEVRSSPAECRSARSLGSFRPCFGGDEERSRNEDALFGTVRLMNALSSLLASLIIGVALSPADVLAKANTNTNTNASSNVNAEAESSDVDGEASPHANGESSNAGVALEIEAEKLEVGSAAASSGEVWAKLFFEAEDQATRVNAAYRSQKAFRAAAVSENSPEPLCRALDVVHSLLAEDDLAADDREAFTDFSLAIEADLTVVFNRTCPIEQPKPDLLAIGHHRDLAAPSPADSEPAAPRLTRKRGIALLTGSTLVSAGVGLLALGSYSLVEEYRASRDLITLIIKDVSVGLNRAEIDHFESVRQRGLAASKLAIGAGIGGGVALVAGAVVLGVVSRRARDERIERAVRRKDRRLIQIQPHLSPDRVGLSIRTRF